MRVMTGRSSRSLRAVPPPSSSHVKQYFITFFCGLHDVLVLCLHELGSLEVTCLVLCTANHYSRRGLLTDHHSSAGRLTCDRCAGGSLGLRFCSLYDQACSQQHKIGSHEGRHPQVERPICWHEPSPRACRGVGTKILTPRSYDLCISFNQAPSVSRGGS
jgi:hypothetical protein